MQRNITFENAVERAASNANVAGIAYSTFRHSEFNDSSRIISGNYIERAIFSEAPNDFAIERCVYESNSPKKNVNATVNLSPFLDVSSEWKSEYKYIPWWVENNHNNRDLFTQKFQEWLNSVCSELDSNHPVNLTKSFNQKSDTIDNLALGFAMVSHEMVQNLTKENFTNPIGYRDSKANKFFIQLTLNSLKSCPEYFKETLSKCGNLGWCFASLRDSQETELIHFRDKEWFKTNIRSKNGRQTRSQKISNTELINTLSSALEDKTMPILACGFYTDVLRVMAYDVFKIFHLGNDRGATQEVVSTLNKPEASNLQLTQGKNDSYDPYLSKYERGFTIIESYLLQENLDRDCISEESILSKENTNKSIECAVSHLKMHTIENCV